MEAECELHSSSAPGSYTRNSHLTSNWGEAHVGSLYPISASTCLEANCGKGKLLQLHHNINVFFFWTAKIYNTWFSILSNTREYRVLLSALYSTVFFYTFLPRLCWKKKKNCRRSNRLFFLKGEQGDRKKTPITDEDVDRNTQAAGGGRVGKPGRPAWSTSADLHRLAEV